MANLSAPEQNEALRKLAALLRGREEVQAKMNPTMMGALMDLILPSSQFVEKASYGDPLFRMPPSGTGGYIPITADKGYAAEATGLLPVAAPGAKKAADVASKIVKEIQTQPPIGAIYSPAPFTVVHGTKQPFTEFQSGMGVTAKDIYTVPESFAQDASAYGQTLIKATASPKKMIDFSDFDKLDEPTVKAIKKAAKDSGITDKYYTFDQFKDDLMNGQMYQVGGGPSTQNAFLAELFTKFDAVKMPDARVGGGVSQSVVFQNPKLLQVKEIDNLPIEEWKKRKGLLD